MNHPTEPKSIRKLLVEPRENCARKSYLFSSLTGFRSRVENKFVSARIQSVPVGIVSVVVEVVLRVVIIARPGIVIKLRCWLKNEAGLLVRVLHSLSFDLVHEVQHVLFFRRNF